LAEWRGWLTSLALHLAALLVLWQIAVPGGQGSGFDDQGATIVKLLEAGHDAVFVEIAERLHLDLRSHDRESPELSDPGTEPAEPATPSELPDIADSAIHSVVVWESGEAEPAAERPVAKVRASPPKASRAKRRKSGNGPDRHAILVGILDGRGPASRSTLVKSGGGTEASEEAVELGLKWLARHQRTDGSWTFQHGPDDPGLLDCPTGATGLALLAFLGAGYTHKEGPYRSQVGGGLKFLVEHQVISRAGGWLQGTGQATMYVQGIGAIALCEGYALTKDAALKRPAQLAVDYIVHAQDPHGGGWRYRVAQPGDTSVVGWQLMALHSALIAELDVPPYVFERSKGFLKSVESEGGGLYGYARRGAVRPSTTAVGLLCRMYLGREESHHGMQRGIKHLSEWGPNSTDMYYSYYATQALHHWGGERWAAWNGVMRDQLVNTQSRAGDTAGSWPTDRSHGAPKGGRLYTTCLSIMTLEVYYRYLSVYRRLKIADEL
jgi:hypothetical protein